MAGVVDEKTVSVTNISTMLDSASVKELFECCGPITNINMTASPSGGQMATVTYGNADHARAACMLTGTPLGDRNLIVVLKGAEPPLPSPSSSPSSSPTGSSLSSFLPSSSPPSSSSLSSSSSSSSSGSGVMGVSALPGVTTTVGTGSMISGVAIPPGVTVPITDSMGTPLSASMLQASVKRAEEVARTIYIGGLTALVTTEMLRNLFSQCGPVTYVKLAGSHLDPTQPARYAFMEFGNVTAAQNALLLTGTVLGERPIKVGKSINPIVKDLAEDPSAPTTSVDDALRKVKEAQARLAEKVKDDKTDGKDEKDDKDGKDKDKERSSRRRSSRSRSRSGSRGRRRRSGSRERRRDRDRDRDRDRERERDKQREREQRERDRRAPRRSSKEREHGGNFGDNGARRGLPPFKNKKPQPDRNGMFWDGFAWNPSAPGTSVPGAKPTPPSRRH